MVLGLGHTHTSPAEKKHTFPWEASTPFALFNIEQASLCREQSVWFFYFRSQLLCGHRVRVVHCRGKYEARFELVVMGGSVNNKAVGGSF